MKQTLILLFLALGFVSCVQGSINCTLNATYCVKLNGKCTADFHGSNSSQCLSQTKLNAAKSNPICCSITQYCVNSTCMDNNIGSPCKSNGDCLATIAGQSMSPVQCSSGYCQAIYGAGDTCKTNSDCYSDSWVSLGCGNTSKCVGKSLGEVCWDYSYPGFYAPADGISTCALPNYCGRPNVTTNFTCQAPLASGAKCTYNGYPPCGPGYQCDGTNCVQVGSVAAGKSCGNATLACSGDAFCYYWTCTSTKAQKAVSCTNDSDCTSIQSNSSCVCQPSGKGYCAFSGENVAAGVTDNEQAVNLVNCLVKNNCSIPFGHDTELTYVNLNTMSCAVENCNSDVKKYNSANCDQVKAAGSCYNNPYCSGFPVWAIIVIVVVAVILVLSVVIVVFLVLRKRRDYSSI